MTLLPQPRVRGTRATLPIPDVLSLHMGTLLILLVMDHYHRRLWEVTYIPTIISRLSISLGETRSRYQYHTRRPMSSTGFVLSLLPRIINSFKKKKKKKIRTLTKLVIAGFGA